MKSRLGVNIDHVATLRQQRDEYYPSLVEAAKISLKNGADQITIHLREDRRHIQDTDVEAIKLVTQELKGLLNLEMGTADDILEIAKVTKPDWVCLVPEKREEKTTEGGLNLLDKTVYEKLKRTCNELKSANPKTKISLFIEAKDAIIESALTLPMNAVEIHTGDFAHAVNQGNDFQKYLKTYMQFQKTIESAGHGYHAGHGLTDKSLMALVERNLFSEYNIGHWIICQAVFEGLGPVVTNLKKMILSQGVR
ncbi:MAG: pyridoxine 5'-phosphate synthase [Bacteriovoracaceae bacterium]|nr:pyridoxine 5'-phosphate synthase [Bacteriovoracaceae bacterium]